MASACGGCAARIAPPRTSDVGSVDVCVMIVPPIRNETNAAINVQVRFMGADGVLDPVNWELPAAGCGRCRPSTTDVRICPSDCSLGASVGPCRLVEVSEVPIRRT